MPLIFRLARGTLLATGIAPTTARITSSWITATAARIAAPSSGIAVAAAPPPGAHLHGTPLLRSNSYVPAAMKSSRVDRNDAVLVSQFVEAGQPLDVIGVLIHAMQHEHHRIVALRVVVFWQADGEIAVHVLDSDFLFCFLGPAGCDHQQNAGIHLHGRANPV